MKKKKITTVVSLVKNYNLARGRDLGLLKVAEESAHGIQPRSKSKYTECL